MNIFASSHSGNSAMSSCNPNQETSQNQDMLRVVFILINRKNLRWFSCILIDLSVHLLFSDWKTDTNTITFLLLKIGQWHQTFIRNDSEKNNPHYNTNSAVQCPSQNISWLASYSFFILFTFHFSVSENANITFFDAFE